MMASVGFETSAGLLQPPSAIPSSSIARDQVPELRNRRWGSLISGCSGMMEHK
jgi:hypothetical protein